MTTLRIVRGLPGSGKSTYAKKLMEALGIKHHYEADMYFIDRDDNYNFDANKLGAAHKWCFNSAEKALMVNEDVIVANTFTMQRELNPYLKMAKDLGVDVEVHEIYTQFNNIHGVPEEAMERMRDRWYNFPGNFKQAEVIRIGKE